MTPHLTIIDGPDIGKTHELKEGKLIIGRDAQSDICIKHASISKLHATIEFKDEQLTVNDCDSTNGIRHANQLAETIILDDQESFSIGDVILRFSNGTNFSQSIEDFSGRITALSDEIKKVIVGQDQVVQQILATIFGGGHCLLVGVPGLAKTITVNSIAKVLDLDFKRVQFTPDLMPSDITGTSVLDEDPEGRRSFKFIKGPIFTQLLLADEINRTPPKTQAALLEAMQEKQVTYADQSLILPKPFIVMATQNPIEQEGTYVLPEAQLDRFMFNIHVDYPSLAEEEEILRRTTTPGSLNLRRIFKAEEILKFQRFVQQVEVSPLVISYAASLSRATRPQGDNCPEELKELIEFGAGPRAGQNLIRGAKAFAAMQGRTFANCQDIKKCCIPVLRHRIAPSFQAQAAGISTESILDKLMELIPEPQTPEFL